MRHGVVACLLAEDTLVLAVTNLSFDMCLSLAVSIMVVGVVSTVAT